jgi:hypothetical protein
MTKKIETIVKFSLAFAFLSCLVGAHDKNNKEVQCEITSETQTFDETEEKYRYREGPLSYEERLKTIVIRAQQKWPEDYQMQEYTVRLQIEKLNEMENIKKTCGFTNE